MKRIVSLIMLIAVFAPSAVQAERNLVPLMDSVSDICPHRPAEPQWMQEIGLREAYQRVLVQDIYRAQSLARIVDAGNCACAIRFPPWEAAQAVFRDRYASAERWEMLEASDTYSREANQLRPSAMEICEAAGNW